MSSVLLARFLPSEYYELFKNQSMPTDWELLIVSPVRSTYGGYYGLVVFTPRPQTLHRSHDNLKILIGLLPVSVILFGVFPRRVRPGFDIRAPQDPPNMKKKYIFFHILGLNLQISYQIVSLFVWLVIPIRDSPSVSSSRWSVHLDTPLLVLLTGAPLDFM